MVFKYLNFTLLISLFLSCGTGIAPIIHELQWQLNLQSIGIEASNSVLPDMVEELQLYLHVEDADGLEDLNEIYIVNDNENLSWQLSKATWSVSQFENKYWIGSSNIRYNNNANFARGEYRVILYDLAGESTQMSFVLNAVDTAELIPELIVPKGSEELTILLPEDVSLYSIWGYDKASNLIYEDANYQSILSLTKLQENSAELVTVMIYYQLLASNIGVIFGPYKTKREQASNPEAEEGFIAAPETFAPEISSLDLENELANTPDLEAPEAVILPDNNTTDSASSADLELQ